jgi:hypothetical protein
MPQCPSPFDNTPSRLLLPKMQCQGHPGNRGFYQFGIREARKGVGDPPRRV